MPQHGVETGTLTNSGNLRQPAMPLYHGDAHGENRRLAARVKFGAPPGESVDRPSYFGLQIHSRTESGDVYVGVGPYGNLWDALVAGAITVVTISNRLSDPSDPDDTGWFLIDSGENLYLLCTITDGDISAADLEIGSSSSLCEFSSYTQSSFRVPLARGETIDGNVVAVPLHEGELVANFEVIFGKLAKYAR